MTGSEWGALVALVLGFLGGVGWMLRQINNEANIRREDDERLGKRIDDLERRHATKDDVDHINRSIDRLHHSIENLTALLQGKNRGSR